MAEVVGLVASIIQIAGTGAKLSTALYHYTTSAVRADQDIAEIADDVDLTSNALESIGKVFESEDAKSIVSKKAIHDANNIIKRCEAVFNDITELVEKRRKVSKEGKKSLGMMGKLSWPLKEQRVELYRRRLESLKTSLGLLLHVLQLAQEQSRGQLEKHALDQEREKIRELHQRQQDSLKSLQTLESNISKVALGDEETLHGLSVSSRVPTLELMLDAPTIENTNMITKAVPDDLSATESETSDSDATATDDEDESLSLEELAKAAKHVQRLMKRITVLQKSFGNTEKSKKYKKKRVNIMYQSFCREWESNLQVKSPDLLRLSSRRRGKRPGVLYPSQSIRSPFWDFSKPFQFNSAGALLERPHHEEFQNFSPDAPAFDLARTRQDDFGSSAQDWLTSQEQIASNYSTTTCVEDYKIVLGPLDFGLDEVVNNMSDKSEPEAGVLVPVRYAGDDTKDEDDPEGSPATPLTPFLGTPMSATLTTPVMPFVPSPQMPTTDTFDYYSFGIPALSAQGFQEEFQRDSFTTGGSHFTYSSGYAPTEPTSFDDSVVPKDTTINHIDVFNNYNMGANFTTGFPQQLPDYQPNVAYHDGQASTSLYQSHRASTPKDRYKCPYPPCTFTSDREPIFEEHMKKAHGANYVRSKIEHNKTHIDNVSVLKDHDNRNHWTQSFDAIFGISVPRKKGYYSHQRSDSNLPNMQEDIRVPPIEVSSVPMLDINLDCSTEEVSTHVTSEATAKPTGNLSQDALIRANKVSLRANTENYVGSSIQSQRISGKERREHVTERRYTPWTGKTTNHTTPVLTKTTADNKEDVFWSGCRDANVSPPILPVEVFDIAFTEPQSDCSGHHPVPPPEPFHPNSAVAMVVTRAREEVPPPLPPPRHIEDFRTVQDPGWQWGHTNSPKDTGFGESRLATVRPGSSLYDASSSRNLRPRQLSADYVSKGHKPSNSQPFDDMSSENSAEHSRDLPPRSSSLLSLKQQALESSSDAYDKHLLSKIGGPDMPARTNIPRSMPRGRLKRRRSESTTPPQLNADDEMNREKKKRIGSQSWSSSKATTTIRNSDSRDIVDVLLDQWTIPTC